MQHGPYDQAGIEAVGRWVAARLRSGDSVLLSGPLGAGKSTLARALIRAACGEPSLDVPSPSFTLVQSFTAPRFTIHHFDLWRLAGADDLIELGWEEACQGVVIVEWPDRLGRLTPADALRLELSLAGPERRTLDAAGWPDRPLPVFNPSAAP